MNQGKVLVLGAGLVARPLVRYLLNHGFELTVADMVKSKAEELIEGHERGRAISLNLDETERVKELVAAADLTVSLLPAPLHPRVAKECIAAGKHMVTASYVSPEMRALDEDARRAGVILLNELGVDPGIDHMSIMRVVEHVHAKGGELVELRSCCGGIPAPEAKDNPLAYKFSWSPAGVLVALTGPCLFLEKGERIDEEAGGLFRHVHETTIEDVGALEFYPNRDSLQYIDTYGLEGIETMFRGTFRYAGWAHLWEALWKVGLLDRSRREDLAGKSWNELLAELVDMDEPKDELRKKVAEKAGVTPDDAAMEQAAWLGLFDATPVKDKGTLLDSLAALLMDKMAYGPNERDMIVMKHDFVARYPDGTEEAITSILLDYGEPSGDSSMARTVALPSAIAARMILEDKIAARGVHIPVLPEIYGPVLKELETLGITLEETFEPR